MFRIERTRWLSLGLVLAVLLLPLPASAGGFRETAAQGWERAWLRLLEWFGWEPVTVETSCAAIDPLGCPSTGSEVPEPPPSTQSCIAIDPNGCPGS